MAINAGFFSSVNGDRMYNKDSFNGYFDGLVSDGVYEKYKNGLVVSAGSGMQVLVDAGKARVNSYFIENTASYAINLTSAHATLDRYTIIVLRIDMENRTGSIAAVDGENSSSPVVPVLTRDSNVYEMQLAEIFIQAGTTVVTNDMITDSRGSEALCGYATVSAVKSQLAHKRVTYTLTQEQTEVEVPDDYDYTVGDLLLVYVNGLLKVPDVDYTEDVSKVTFTNTLQTDDVVQLIIIKTAIINS